jgi:hypothetical protein
MRAPVKSLLAVGGAFAAGVAVTAAYVAPRPGPADAPRGMAGGTPDAAPAPRAAHLSEDGAASGGWTDPVRPKAAGAGSPAAPPRPPLVFSLHGQRSADGAAPESAAARIPPPRRPSASELLARRDGSGDPADAADGNAAPRQSAGAPRGVENVRAAPRRAEPDDARVAERPAKRFVAARRTEPDRASDSVALRRMEGFDRYERDVADRPPTYRRRITSAEAGGILRWLGQP